VDALAPLVSRPVRKLINEATFAILGSGSLRQWEIARAPRGRSPITCRSSTRHGCAGAAPVRPRPAPGPPGPPPIDDLFGNPSALTPVGA